MCYYGDVAEEYLTGLFFRDTGKGKSKGNVDLYSVYT